MNMPRRNKGRGQACRLATPGWPEPGHSLPRQPAWRGKPASLTPPSVPAFLTLLLALLASTLGCTPESGAPVGEPTRYIIGLSPFLPDGVKDDVYRRVVGFVLEDMPQGSSLWLYDAFHNRTIAHIEVPRIRAFRSGKTRANQFKEDILKIRQFLAAPHPRPEHEGLSFDAAVRFPQFTDFVGANLVQSNHPTMLVVLGSPLYVDEREPGFSMVNGYFPSDGHLLAARERTVYGLEGRGDALPGVAVHYGYFGDVWESEIHQERVGRFWSLYLQRQGGRLATFCGDLATVFNALRTPGGGPAGGRRHELDPAQTKVEMRRVTREVSQADWITGDLDGTPPPPPGRMIGPMKIGIRWRGDLDLDLYARPTPQAETLFFDHLQSPEGYYFKDHRTSPDLDYEFIEFVAPVDVREVRASVNFYEGTAPEGTGGEVRILFDDRIYSSRFTLPARHGNQGRAGQGQDSFWSTLDLPRILGLR